MNVTRMGFLDKQTVYFAQFFGRTLAPDEVVMVRGKYAPAFYFSFAVSLFFLVCVCCLPRGLLYTGVCRGRGASRVGYDHAGRGGDLRGKYAPAFYFSFAVRALTEKMVGWYFCLHMGH
jgi:hypothetical protein